MKLTIEQFNFIRRCVDYWEPSMCSGDNDNTFYARAEKEDAIKNSIIKNQKLMKALSELEY